MKKNNNLLFEVRWMDDSEEYIPLNVMEMARQERRMPLSHQQMTAHLMGKHREDIFTVVEGLFKDFMRAPAKDRVKIAQVLFPYFFLKSDIAVNINMIDTLNREMHDVSNFSTSQLLKLERFLLDLRDEAKGNG
jgi:hypothetical protein